MPKFELIPNPSTVFDSRIESNTEKILRGLLFIVPNPANIITTDEVEYDERIKLFDNDGPFVQIWAHNAPEEGSDSNWTDHGIPSETLNSVGLTTEEFKMPRWREGLFPHRIPAEWLKGISEGCHLYMSYTSDNGKTIYFDMVCQQKDYRYERHGTFDEVLEKVIAKTGF